MLEGQTFPEVFPDYTVPDNLKYILSNAVVSKVVMKQQKRQLVIHLKSEHIIQRKVLNKVAYDLKKELFGKTSVFISFDDTYELSAAYTLESITNDYWGSILHEVKNMGRVEYSLLANGEWGFEGNIMTILLEDSFLARDKSRVLKEYMEHLFSHRFGKEIQVGFDFTDDAKQAFYKARNHKLNLEVDMVMSQIKKWRVRRKRTERKNGKRQKKKRSIIIIPVISLKSGQGDRNLVREDVPKIRMLFMGRIVMGKLFLWRKSWTKSDRLLCAERF